jgi:hypothetical protein
MLDLMAPDPAVRGAAPMAAHLAEAVGVAGILLFAGILSAIVLVANRRWGDALPAGSFTLVFTVNAALVGFARDQLVLVPAVAAAGVAADVLRGRLPLRAFAFAVPAMYFAVYFLALALAKGVWWSVHLWTGVILLAGGVGWLLSYLVAPPVASPARET